MIGLAVAMISAYLLGSFPSAYVAGLLVKGIDIREHGSGNIGASNVFRVVGKKWGILVLVIDILKGFIAVAVIASFCHAHQAIFAKLPYGLIVGIAAIAGHNWTVFLKFRGGKGVATSLGVALALLPKAALSALCVWILVLIPFGYISVSSLVAAASFPFWIFFWYRLVAGFLPIFAMSVLVSILIVYTHRSNIQRLKQGKEAKVWHK